MKKSPINVLVIRLQACFETLQVPITDAEIEKIAITIHDTMTGQMRKYHNLEHVFAVAEPFTEPLQVLACLFHDMVYYQVDGGFGLHTKKIAEKYIQITDNQIFIQPSVESLPAWWDLLLRLFNFEVGNAPSIYGGANEFLSAVVAMEFLSPYLNQKQLLKIATCIEGTIPFKGFDLEGNGHFEAVEIRLTQINQDFNLGLSAKDIDEILYKAVAVANQDVANFANLDTANFLDITWLLIYESNMHLNTSENIAYTTSAYREGLMKTQQFLKNLKTAHIFHQYKGLPTQIEYARLTHQAQRNMAIAREYMAAKLCMSTLFEALAMETGGDAPLSMMVGMVRTDNDREVQRAEDYLPALKDQEKQPCNPKVWHLLTYGRNDDTDFDMRRSPLSAYLYEMLGTAELIGLLNTAKQLFAQEIAYKDYIETCNPLLISRFAKACAQVAITRSKALEKFFVEEA